MNFILCQHIVLRNNRSEYQNLLHSCPNIWNNEKPLRWIKDIKQLATNTQTDDHFFRVHPWNPGWNGSVKNIYFIYFFLSCFERVCVLLLNFTWLWLKPARVTFTHPVCTAVFNSSPPRQNDRHFADIIFKCLFLNEKFCILIQISLQLVPKGPIDNSIGLDNGLVPNRRMAIIWTNAVPVHWRIYGAYFHFLSIVNPSPWKTCHTLTVPLVLMTWPFNSFVCILVINVVWSIKIADNRPLDGWMGLLPSMPGIAKEIREKQQQQQYLAVNRIILPCKIHDGYLNPAIHKYFYCPTIWKLQLRILTTLYRNVLGKGSGNPKVSLQWRHN